jgi:hypothetical protein
MTPIGDTTEETFDVASELEQLESLTMATLKRRYRQATGHDSKTRNRQYLIRRLIWIAQAAVHGGLGEDALALAAALANDASIRASPPRARVLGVQAPNADATRDQRLPRPGHAIVRRYKGETLRVTVLSQGFEFRGERYDSLSAIAKAVTGSHVNGYRFFRLLKEAA